MCFLELHKPFHFDLFGQILVTVWPQLAGQEVVSEDVYIGWPHLVKSAEFYLLQKEGRRVTEGGCRFRTQPGAWHTEVQETFSYPLGAYGPAITGCVPHGQRLCLTGFHNLDSSPGPGTCTHHSAMLK